jgi:hypothetical protein
VSTQTIRQSTILIASGKRTSVYSSLDQVPTALKRKLIHSTSGSNSATILLADRAGREEIVRALRGMPSHVQARLTPPKLPWTEAFARKQEVVLPPAALAAAPAPLAPTNPPFDPFRLARKLRHSNFSAWPGTTLAWARAHWPELLLPVGVAIGLWALLAS